MTFFGIEDYIVVFLGCLAICGVVFDWKNPFKRKHNSMTQSQSGNLEDKKE